MKSYELLTPRRETPGKPDIPIGAIVTLDDREGGYLAAIGAVRLVGNAVSPKPIAAPKPDAPWHEGKNNTVLLGIYTDLGLSGLRANSKRADLIAAIEAKRGEIAAGAAQGNDTAPGAEGNDTASASGGDDTTAGAQGDDPTAGGAS